MTELYTTQHVDRNVTVRDYREMGAGHLRITSIFDTVQGEGPYAGHPAVFVRLAGCNRGDKYACGFCDTYFNYAAGKVMSYAEIAGQITQYKHKLVVITGGEPMMQEQLSGFTYYLRKLDYAVQIESNGDRLLEKPFCGLLIVSPKVVRSGTYLMLNPDVLERANGLKFVVDHRIESPYHEVPAYAHQVKYPVYVSPICVYKRPAAIGELASAWNRDLVDVELTAKNHAYAADMAMEYGFRVSMQTHLFLSVQ